MRHSVYGKKLGRNKNQRTALFKSLVQSLILSGSIQTTDTKAKSIKGLVDKIINQAKTPATQRLVSQFLTQKKVQEKLINEIVPALSGRTSGYTSVVKLGRRLGDGAPIVKMSLLLESIIAPKVTKETKSKEESKTETKAAKEIEKEEK